MRGKNLINFFILTAFVLSFAFLSPLKAQDEKSAWFDITIIADLISKDLYNLDINSIDEKMETFINYDSICSIEVIDSITEEVVSKKDKRRCPQKSSRTLFVVYDGEIVGSVKISFRDEMFDATNKVILSKDEIEFLNKHPIIKVSNEMSYTPFDFIQGGEPSGFSIEYLKLLESKIPNIKFTFINGYHWNMLRRLYDSKDIDILHTRSSEDGNKNSLFTPYFIELYMGLATRSDEDIGSIAELVRKNKKLAVVRGIDYTKKIQSLYPNLDLYFATSAQKALKAISDGEADAYIDSSAVLRHIANNNLLTNIKITESANLRPFELFRAKIEVRSDLKPLYSMITKAMERVSIDEMDKLRDRWFRESQDRLHQKIILGDDEKRYLKKKRTIKATSLNSFEPFFNKPADTPAQGLSVDIVNILAQQLGVDVEYLPSPSCEILKDGLEKGEFDIALNIHKNDTNKNMGLFSPPYFTNSIILAKQKNSDPVLDLSNLEGSTVSIKKGCKIGEFFKKNYPDIEIIEFDTNLDVLKALQLGDAKIAAMDEASFTYNKQKHQLDDLEAEHDVRGLDIEPKLHLVVGNKESPLLPLINKALNSIPPYTKKGIEDKWITPNMQEERRVKLTSLEKNYLIQKESINICLQRDNSPFEAINEGEIEGMISELLKHISKTSDIDFSIIEIENPYEAEGLAKQKKCDIIPFVVANPKTKEFLNFSKPIIKDFSVFITKEDHPYIATIDDIKDKKIALVKNSPLSDFFLENYPFLDILLLNTHAEAYKAVANREADITVDFLSSADERIKNLGLYDLKFSGNTPFDEPFRIGVVKSENYLLSIINKSLNLLSENELQEMMDRWVSIKFEYRFDYKLFWEMAFIIGLIIALGVFYNYKTLRFNREISKKNRELNTQKELVEEKNRELIDINKQIQDSINYATYIQRSFLPTIEMMRNDFRDIFVLWEPRDGVGGDIYFYDSTRDGYILAVIDCTGHGVPGGFITMIVGTALRSVKEDEGMYHTPSELLRFLNVNIKLQLNQNKPDTLSDDGLDIGLCYIDRASRGITYCGAKISLYYTEDNELKIIKGDNQSIGYKKSKLQYEYKEHYLPYKKGRTFYLFSDGIVDQGGGSKGFPFGNKRIKELLLDLEGHDFETRDQRVLAVLRKYQGEMKRRDDITMIGFRID
jgi:ABC-type amino acid transport substrate-binding protein/serine phosphatase RsbU (regulator of sigma subunit)